MSIPFSYRLLLGAFVSLGVVPWWLPPCLCLYNFPVCVCVLLWCSIIMCSFPFCEHCACMWKFLSPPGPLVFPGPIFMNQREQALARIRPLQALRHKRDKHKGTTVFTNSTGAETPLLTHLPIWLSRPPPLSLSEGRTLVSSPGLIVINNAACWQERLTDSWDKWLRKPLDQVKDHSQQTDYLS